MVEQSLKQSVGLVQQYGDFVFGIIVFVRKQKRIGSVAEQVHVAFEVSVMSVVLDVLDKWFISSCFLLLFIYRFRKWLSSFLYKRIVYFYLYQIDFSLFDILERDLSFLDLEYGSIFQN